MIEELSDEIEINNEVPNEITSNYKEFNLPDHRALLAKAEDVIEILKESINKLEKDKAITNKLHTRYYEEVVKILDYVGILSKPAFDIQNEMEEYYTLQFIHTPALAKEIYFSHYDLIHHKYNILKNRCHRLLDDLDEMYMKKFNLNPPNWKI